MLAVGRNSRAPLTHLFQPKAPPGTATFDLSVFIGGKLAQTAIDNGGSDSYFAPLLGHLIRISRV